LVRSQKKVKRWTYENRLVYYHSLPSFDMKGLNCSKQVKTSVAEHNRPTDFTYQVKAIKEATNIAKNINTATHGNNQLL